MAATSSPWRAVLERLRHPDVWGPGGLSPLEAFRRTGRGWVARCPGGAHPDRHPSFSMPEGRSFGHCFACGFRRTWIGFVLERQGHSPDARGAAFRAALATLAERAGMPLGEPARSLDGSPAPPPLAVLAGILKRSLLAEHPRAAACRAYLGSRRVPEAVIPRLPVGAWTEAETIRGALRAAQLPLALLREHGLLARYIPSHPLLFLYEDADGVTGFKCRKPVLGEKSVLNAPGFGGAVEGRSLFGLGVARETIERYGRVILVEGEFDALGWYAASFAVGRSLELVALGGTAKPTVEKFRTLRALGARVAYLALDADPAGEAAAAVACRSAWEAGLDVGILSMPDGCKDPDEVLARHGPADGVMRLFTLDRAEPGAVWLARYLVRTRPPTTPDAHVQLRQATAPAALAMPPTQREAFAQALAPPLGTTPAALHEEWMATARERRDAALRADLSAWARQFAVSVGHGALLERLQDAETRLAQARAQLASSAATLLPPAHVRDRA